MHFSSAVLLRTARTEDHSLILLKQALGFALHGQGVKSLRAFGL